MNQFSLSSVYATMISSRKIKSYRKISKDLTEPSLSGAGLSIVAALSMLFLFGMELNDYLTVSTSTSVVVDKGTDGEFLRIKLNISFPSLSCEFASVDLNDVLGTNRVNITKTIRKFSIDHNLSSTGPESDPGGVPKLLKHGDEGNEEYGEGSVSLTAVKFERFTHQYPILVVNFFSPWSYWSNRLKPSWEKTSQIIRERYDPDLDGRILLAKVDCTVEVELCKRNHIQEYPSIRIFRKGSDVRDVHGRDHESYYGDRDTDTLVATMESLVGTDNTKRPASMTGGCRIEGFLLVKRVPGNLVVSARSGAHSFDPSHINMSHFITHLSFGKSVSSNLGSEVNQLKGREYVTQHEDVTIEHYLQIVKTELVSRRSGREHKLIEKYEYTTHSSLVQSFDAPVVKFHLELSPLQVVVTEYHKSFSHFITNVYAIIGGVFTVVRILNSVLHNTIRHVKKVELGKQF